MVDFLEVRVISSRDTVLALANLIPPQFALVFNEQYYKEGDSSVLLGEDEGLSYELTLLGGIAYLTIKRPGDLMSPEEVLRFYRVHAFGSDEMLAFYPQARRATDQALIDAAIAAGEEWNSRLV